MTKISEIRIEVDAAQALAEWKFQFAKLLDEGAEAIATESGTDLVTLEHYKQAAQTIWPKLSETISQTQCAHGKRKAA